MGVVINQSIKGTVITYIGVIIGFITTMFVATKFLAPEEIGLTKVIYEIALLFATFAQMGTSTSAMRFFPYFRDETSKHHGFFFYMLAFPIIGCLIFIPLYYILGDAITDFFKDKSALLVNYYSWIPVLIIFIVFWTISETYSTLNLRIAFPKSIREVLVRILLLAVYLLYAFDYFNLNEFVGGYIAVYGVAMLVAIIYIMRTSAITLKHDNSFVSPDLRKKIFHYTSFLILGALGNTVIAKLDLFMVSSEIGLASAGVFTIAVYMVAMIEIPSRSISSISMPLAAKALKEGNIEEANHLYRKVSLHQFIAGSIIFLLIWINIDNIFNMIPNGHLYQGGKWVVFLIGIAKIFEISLNFGSSMISFSRYYYWEFLFTIIMVGVTIGTNLIFIPMFEMNGAALATLITTFTVLSFKQWIILVKIKGNPWSFSQFKQLVVILLLLGVNALIPQFANVWIDAFLRTGIIGLITVALIFALKISPEINGIMTSLGQKFINRSK